MPLSETPLSDLIEKKSDNFSLEMDAKGYIRAIPKPDELAAIEAYLAEELTRTLSDYEPVFQEAVDNINTYRHTKRFIEGSGKAILPAPIARIPADQIIAGAFNAIMRARPVFSFDPYFSGKFPVMVAAPPPQPGLPPVPEGTPLSVAKDAEDIGKNLERGFEFKIRERLDYETKLFKSIRGAVIGCPFWWKTYADPKSRDTTGPKVNGAFIDLDEKMAYRQEGEIVHQDLVPFFNFIKPIDVADDELDEGPWCAERTPCDPGKILKGFYSGDYFLIKDEEAAEKISKNVSDVHNPFQQAIASITESKTPQKPRQQCNKWLVWFYRDARYTDPETKQKSIKTLNLLGEFHLGEKKLLNCHLNPNEHQSRAYTLIDQMEDGDSTVKVLKWHQDVATHLMQAQIKNAFIANNINYWHDPDSEAATFFKSHPTIGPGEHISAAGNGTDWGTFVAGENHESMLQTWTAVVAEARVASTVTGIKSGEELPGRTPSSTMQQVMQAGSQVDTLFLRRLSRQLCRNVRFYLETARQFQPMGETVPIFDPVQKQILEIPFRFPVGEVLDNFRIALTASDEALAKERDAERIAAWKTLLMQDAEFVAKISAALIDPKATPAITALYQKMLERDQRLTAKIIQLSDTNEEDFDLTNEIEALIQERQMAMQAMQVQQANEAMNAQNQAPNPQGAIPGPGGAPNGGGPPGAGAQPGVPSPASAPPPSGVPGAVM